MRIVILCLGLLFLAACSDSFASGPRGRGRRGTPVKAGSSELDSVTGGFDWLFYFDGTNFANPWTNAGGSDSLSLDSDGETTATGDQATTGLSNIGSAREGKAIDFNATDCYREEATSGVNAIGPDFHMRLVLYPDVIGANDWIFDYNNGATDEIRIYGSASGTLRARIDNGVNEAGSADVNVSSVPTSQWIMVDIVVDADGGAAGVNKVTMYVNKLTTATADGSTAGLGIASGGTISIGDFTGCGDFNFDGKILFIGLRNSISGITESKHDEDCESIGACS